MPQALFWLSLQAFGAGGSLSTAEAEPVPPPSATGGGGGGEPSRTGSSADIGNNSSSNCSGSESSGENRSPTSLASQRVSDGGLAAARSVAVVCLSGEEEVLGLGITGPVFAGR